MQDMYMYIHGVCMCLPAWAVARSCSMLRVYVCLVRVGKGGFLPFLLNYSN